METKQNARLKIANVHDIMIALNPYDTDNTASSLVEEHVISILIAESDPDLVVLYAEFLSRCHVNVTNVVDSNECLSALKFNNFDLIILDEHLSGKHFDQGSCNRNPLSKTISTNRINHNQSLISNFNWNRFS